MNSLYLVNVKASDHTYIHTLNWFATRMSCFSLWATYTEIYNVRRNVHNQKHGQTVNKVKLVKPRIKLWQVFEQRNNPDHRNTFIYFCLLKLRLRLIWHELYSKHAKWRYKTLEMKVSITGNSCTSNKAQYKATIYIQKLVRNFNLHCKQSQQSTVKKLRGSPSRSSINTTTQTILRNIYASKLAWKMWEKKILPL